MTDDMRPILLTGATGFVGARLWEPISKLGKPVRCLTRDVDRAKKKYPERDWIAGDVSDAGSLNAAMTGCSAAYYLVHAMHEGADFRRRESEAARRFAAACAESGIERIIYLGGVMPKSDPSEHLASRAEVGEILRSGSVPAMELRASMIVGPGSLSWMIVRDLAARLPFMILPRWMNSLTEPVGIDDVLAALAASLAVPLEGSLCLDLPGPEKLTGKEILYKTAHLLGRRDPVTVEVPVLSPWLSSHWVRFVTRADWTVAREVVIGLKHDLLASSAEIWPLLKHTDLHTFDTAACKAIAEEAGLNSQKGIGFAIERAIAKFWSSS